MNIVLPPVGTALVLVMPQLLIAVVMVLPPVGTVLVIVMPHLLIAIVVVMPPVGTALHFNVLAVDCCCCDTAARGDCSGYCTSGGTTTSEDDAFGGSLTPSNGPCCVHGYCSGVENDLLSVGFPSDILGLFSYVLNADKWSTVLSSFLRFLYMCAMHLDCLSRVSLVFD